MVPIAAKYCARTSLDERLLGLVGVPGHTGARPYGLVAIRTRLAELAPGQPPAAVAAIERLCDAVAQHLTER